MLSGGTTKIGRCNLVIDELRRMGAPNDCDIRKFVKEEWGQPLCMWLRIQKYARLCARQLEFVS